MLSAFMWLLKVWSIRMMKQLITSMKKDAILRAITILKNISTLHLRFRMILCASKDDEVVEYAMSRTLSPMMVAEYQLQLPDKSVLQKKLQELINMPLLEEGE